MKLKSNQLAKETKQLLIKDYTKGARKKELMSNYRISRSYLKSILRDNGIKTSYDPRDRVRKYTTNHQFFDLIDSEEKAYWFGFLLADGYVSSKTGNWALQLRLIDLDAVTKFKNSLNSDVPIRTIHSTKRKTCYELSISSKYMIESLAKYGLVNNKTHRIYIPENIDKELWPHIVRGYFDGDGCIYIRNNKYKNISCSITSSSPKILLQIQEYLKNQKILRNKNYLVDRKTYQTLVIGAKTEVRNFLSLIYGKATIYLNRKFDKAQKILASVNTRWTIGSPS